MKTQLGTPELGESVAPRRRRGLRPGVTTGTCAAAAAKAACLSLRGVAVPSVSLRVPAGVTVELAVKSLVRAEMTARASVIKDAGDDPDVTHGAEVGARVTLIGEPIRLRAGWHVVGEGVVSCRLAPGSVISLAAGRGVGVVTRPGLGIPVGGPAINPVPRRMIAAAVRDSLEQLPPSIRVEVFVVGGEALAQRTLNARLGVVGGLSILGTTGIVRPYSTAAWRASVLQGVDVAAAAAVGCVVASTGGRSEKYARRRYPELPDVAFVEMGEFTGHLLLRARQRQVPWVVLAGFIGKLSKIANGNFMTHVAGNQVDLRYLAGVAQRAGAPPALVAATRTANTARHVQELVLNAGTTPFFDLVCVDVRDRCEQFVGSAPRVGVLLFDFDGELLGSAGSV